MAKNIKPNLEICAKELQLPSRSNRSNPFALGLFSPRSPWLDLKGLKLSTGGAFCKTQNQTQPSSHSSTSPLQIHQPSHLFCFALKVKG